MSDNITHLYPNKKLAICRTCLKSGGWNTTGFTLSGQILLSFNPQGVGSVNDPSTGSPLLTVSKKVFSYHVPHSSSSTLKEQISSCFSSNSSSSTVLHEWSWFSESNRLLLTISDHFSIEITSEFSIVLTFSSDSSISYNLARVDTLSGGTYLKKVVGRDLCTGRLLFEKGKLNSPDLIPNIVPSKSRPVSNSDFKAVVDDCDSFMQNLNNPNKTTPKSDHRQKLKDKISENISNLEKSLDLDTFSLYQSRKELRKQSKLLKQPPTSTNISNPLLVPFVPVKPGRSKVDSLHWNKFEELVRTTGMLFITVLIDSVDEKESRKAKVVMEQTRFELENFEKSRNRDRLESLKEFEIYNFVLQNDNYYSIIEKFGIIDFPAYLCFHSGNLVYGQYSLIGNVNHVSALLATLSECKSLIDQGVYLDSNYKFPPSIEKLTRVKDELSNLSKSFAQKL
ncbi:hypothetical protein GEMRC1_008163 [Eukaryota sp. GEM-RC1]